MISNNTFLYNDQKWEYSVTYKNQKNMYLRCKQGKILISAPFFVTKQNIEKFILQNIEKLILQSEKEKQVENKIVISKNSFIYILGKKNDISIKHNHKTKIYLADKKMLIYTQYNINNQDEQKKLETKINSFLKKIAFNIFNERFFYWKKNMNLEVNKFSLRLMTSKWGVCFYNSKDITLNFKLIHFDLEIIDYVIIHELAHLVHNSHNKDFWSLVAIFFPEYKEARKLLKYSNVGVVYENY